MYRKIKKLYYRKLAKFRLIHRYEYLDEVNGILEEYLTSKLLNGDSQEFLAHGRSELTKKQAENRETRSMLAFLKKVK